MIQLQNIHKSFGAQHVLRGVNMQIPKGKITVIIGPSGCGKTVLLRHIIGLLKPDRGLLKVDGVDINTLGKSELNEFRKRYGMLFQHAALFDSFNVADNIAFPLIEHGREKNPQKLKKIVSEKYK